MILIKIVLAHLIGDFLLQPLHWVRDKEKKKIRSLRLYQHIALHWLLMMLLLGENGYWLPVTVIAISHLCIDLAKLYLQREKTEIVWFMGDQLMHLVSIVGVWMIWFQPEVRFHEIWQQEQFLLYVTAALFLTKPMSIIMTVVMKPWSAVIPDQEDQSLANAGKFIGILERLMVFVFIVSNHWEAVGFLLAAKSVFRFGDLKEAGSRKLTEYILIGTLLSFGIAIVTALAADVLLFFVFMRG